MAEIEKCPKCGGKSTGEVFYSLPKQTKCSLCGHVYCFGVGLKMIPHEESGRIRNWKPDPSKKYPKRHQLDIETPIKTDWGHDPDLFLETKSKVMVKFEGDKGTDQ